MLTEEQLLQIAEKAAKVASAVLSLPAFYPSGKHNIYTVRLVNDPAFPEDGLFSNEGNEILLNTASLEPFPPSVGVKNEDFRLALMATFVIFHEMRHLYQKRAVELYTLNRMMGGRVFKQPESDKKCALWKQELEGYVLAESAETDVEADAEDFAWYLIHQYPVESEMTLKSRRLGAMKRKYNKVEIPDI